MPVCQGQEAKALKPWGRNMLSEDRDLKPMEDWAGDQDRTRPQGSLSKPTHFQEIGQFPKSSDLEGSKHRKPRKGQRRKVKCLKREKIISRKSYQKYQIVQKDHTWQWKWAPGCWLLTLLTEQKQKAAVVTRCSPCRTLDRGLSPTRPQLCPTCRAVWARCLLHLLNPSILISNQIPPSPLLLAWPQMNSVRLGENLPTYPLDGFSSWGSIPPTDLLRSYTFRAELNLFPLLQ